MELSDYSIDELKNYISSGSDNFTDLDEAEEIQEYIDHNRNGEKKEKKRSLPFDLYFGEMDLTDLQKKDRKEFAEKMQEIVLTILTLIEIQEQMGEVNELMTVNQLSGDYQRLAVDYLDSDDYDWVSEYSQQYAKDFVDTTIENWNDEWYRSQDRATYNAENEANTILNRKDFTEAKKRGFFHKEWVTMRDKRVRETHQEVDGEVIPIDDFFQVGEAQMLYPKDIANAVDYPEEYVNCRCSIVYRP